MSHTDDLDLERYYLGLMEGSELDAMEEHILGCGNCAERAAEAQDYVDAMRRGIIAGEWDLGRPPKKGAKPSIDNPAGSGIIEVGIRNSAAGSDWTKKRKP